MINILREKYGQDCLQKYFKIEDLLEVDKLYPPEQEDLGDLSLLRKIFALQLALGKQEPLWTIWGWSLLAPGMVIKKEKGPLFNEKRKQLILESLARRREEDIYGLVGDLARVFGEWETEFSSAVEMFKKIYNLLGSPSDMVSDVAYPRNIIVGGAYFIKGVPGVDDLRKLAELQFEVGMERTNKSKRWLITMGTEEANLPISGLTDGAFPPDEEIDVAMHSHPERFPNQPSSFDLDAFAEGKLHFIIHKLSLTKYDKTAPLVFYTWDKVTPGLYNP